MENFDTKEMTLSEHKQALEKWEKSLKEKNQKEEESKIKEDDWEC